LITNNNLRFNKTVNYVLVDKKNTSEQNPFLIIVNDTDPQLKQMIHIVTILISIILGVIGIVFIYLLARIYCIIVATRQEKRQRRKEFLEQSKLINFRGVAPDFSTMPHESIIRVQLNT
jgi:hypothetical protein